MDRKRDATGKFKPNDPANALTQRVYGVRIKQSLEAQLNKLAEESGLTPTQWIRAVTEDAIAEKIIYVDE
jgi:antitoxin component of RelBE/YafQ-DinJ toxin-antitoxin module